MINTEPNIDQKKVVMTTEKWLKVAIYVGGFLILSTNTINYWITSVAKNTEDISYEKGASKRRLDHAMEKLNYQLEIKDLKEKLAKCQFN